MESSTVAPAAGGPRVRDDRRHDGARRRALRRPRGGQRYKRDGEWRERLLSRARRDRLRDRPRADRPRPRARRPRRAAVPHAPRVDVRATSRSSRAGAVVVPIYPTNSPEECAWVAGNSESRAVVCEDAEQVAKIVAVRDQLPALERRRSSIDAGGDADDAVALDELRERGRDRDAAELRERARGGQARGPVHDHLHVGHDRPAEGLRAHARQLPPGA